VLSRTVRLLSQLTNQVALVQYPSVARSRIRHIELVSLGSRRLLSVLITDSGAVEQRVIELQEELDDAEIAEIRGAINGAAAGLQLIDAAVRLRDLPGHLTERTRELVAPVAGALLDQIAANRQDKLVMAGAANLARTETDFPGSITPVLEAIEEQVVLLRLFDEMALDQHGVAVSIGRENAVTGLSETSVMSSGYTSGSDLARVGLLGPLRMDYSGNMAAVRAVARYLSRLLGD
jgi:heat-inducible transcriptional repressor